LPPFPTKQTAPTPEIPVKTELRAYQLRLSTKIGTQGLSKVFIEKYRGDERIEIEPLVKKKSSTEIFPKINARDMYESNILRLKNPFSESEEKAQLKPLRHEKKVNSKKNMVTYKPTVITIIDQVKNDNATQPSANKNPSHNDPDSKLVDILEKIMQNKLKEEERASPPAEGWQGVEVKSLVPTKAGVYKFASPHVHDPGREALMKPFYNIFSKQGDGGDDRRLHSFLVKKFDPDGVNSARTGPLNDRMNLRKDASVGKTPSVLMNGAKKYIL